MDLIKLHQAVNARIQKVDFSQLWPDFRPLRFALYDQDTCCFDGKIIEKTADFLGNTAICYNGEYVAIWNISEETDFDILASKMIHEMFHGFQKMHCENRFPDELHALYNYRYSDENLSVKLMENKILAELSYAFSDVKFRQFLQLRKYRAVKFPTEFLYEARIEQIEGCANFVELNALKQISTCEDKLNQMRASILSLLPVRISSYDVGALILYVLNENGIAYHHGFSDVTFSEGLIDDIPFEEINFARCMKDEINTYYSKADRIIHDAIAKNDIVMQQEAPLLGVNVYNAVYRNQHIISKYFVMYGNADVPTILQGDFVIETPQEGIINKIYRL